MIRVHVQAFRALLAPLEAAPTGLLVVMAALDGEDVALTPQQPARTPYVVVRVGGFGQDSDRLAPWSQAVDGRLFVAHAGATWDEAAWAVEHTRSVLLDVVPTVTGRSCAPLALVDSSPIAADRDASPPLFETTDLYAFRSFAGA